MTDEKQKTGAERGGPRKAALELCFVSFIGIVVSAGFVVALNYDIVSARAPLFIMVPLLFLIAAQLLQQPPNRTFC